MEILFDTTFPLDAIDWLLFYYVLSIARPQGGHEITEINTYGIDIMLILDVSGTMGERDMVMEGEYVSRLKATKGVLDRFINGRKADRIGLLAFATNALTRAPLTVDYQLIIKALDEITLELFPEDQRRTSIGNAIATGVSRLRNSKAESKIIILLTDGANTAGNIAPNSAAQIAQSEDIRIYTIGFGSPRRTDVDEQNLAQIAETTGGKFFRSKSLTDLADVYEKIDELEKSEVKINNYTQWEELFPWLLWSGFILLVLETLLSQLICVKVP